MREPILQLYHDTKDRGLAELIRELIRGRSNASGLLYLDSNSATTTVSNILVSPGSLILLTPMTPSAAAEYGTIYVSDIGDESFTVTHTTDTTTRVFAYLIITRDAIYTNPLGEEFTSEFSTEYT